MVNCQKNQIRSLKLHLVSINTYGTFLKIKELVKPIIIFLHCSKGVTPRLYELPKIHQASVPLRPIVSFINLPTCNLSKFLLSYFFVCKSL